MNQSTSSLSNHDRVFQAKKTLAEQNNFIQRLNEKRQSKNQSIQNLLSSSIQKAKEKVNALSHSQSQSILNNSSFQIKKSGHEQGLAIAGAMKALQTRISQLQRSIDSMQKQKKLQSEEIENLIHEKRVILNNLEETKRKLLASQQQMREQSIQMKDIQSKYLSSEVEVKNLKIQINSKINQIQQLKVIKDKPQKTNELKKSQNQMMYQTKLQELKLREQQIQNLEADRLKEIKENKLKITKLEEHINRLQSTLVMNETQIAKLNNDLDCEKIKKGNNQRQQHNNQSLRSLYTSRITQLQQELVSVKTKKNKKESTTIKIEQLSEQVQRAHEKLQQTLRSLKRNQQKLKRQEKQSKEYRTKFWEIKDVLSEIIDKINKLPNGITSQLKYLMVRANKIQIQNNPTSNRTNTTPLKNRRSSLKSSSDSKSKSKKKSLKMDDLNSSKNSMNSHNSAKSKKSIRGREEEKTKKSVIISSQRMELGANQISTLQKKIVQIKKEYKKLISTIKDDEDQLLRGQLNLLAQELHERSEQLTILKRKSFRN